MSLFCKHRKWDYPECDHLNIAIQFLLKNPEENKKAIEEIYFAIKKANGYFYDDVKTTLEKQFKYSFD